MTAASVEFVPIQSLDIEAENRITFDLYINLPLNNRFLLYRRAGGHIENGRMQKLLEGNVGNFYIDRKDYREFVKYVAGRMTNLMSTELSAESRRQMTAMARAILSSTISQKDSATTNALLGNLTLIATQVIESVIDKSLLYQKKTFQKFVALAERGTDFQRHPLNVASMAVLITYGIGYTNERIISDVAMAGLLHDVGLSKMPTKIMAAAHKMGKLNLEERAELHKHPELSLQILKEKRVHLSNMAETIILQHHEEYNGNGYPFGVRGYNLNEMAQILRVADDLDLMIGDGFSKAGELKLRVLSHLDELHRSKVCEPSLLSRIRTLLI